jgi:hypothetical protein
MYSNLVGLLSVSVGLVKRGKLKNARRRVAYYVPGTLHVSEYFWYKNYELRMKSKLSVKTVACNGHQLVKSNLKTPVHVSNNKNVCDNY